MYPFLVITKLRYLHCCYGHFLSHSSIVFFPRLLLIAVSQSACRQWRRDQSNHQQWSFSAGLTIDGWELPIPMMIEHVIFCSRLICSSCWRTMLSLYFNHGDAWCLEWSESMSLFVLFFYIRVFRKWPCVMYQSCSDWYVPFPTRTGQNFQCFRWELNHVLFPMTVSSIKATVSHQIGPCGGSQQAASTAIWKQEN